ncbi:MAG: ATP-binding cassette domain-containing protein [Lachnospiraceae bacterium]|nr:ATP-binding cassette domain-containing protein [Lachnospiraceae bacterium]
MKLSAEKIVKWYYRSRGEANHFYAVRETDFELLPGKLTMITGHSGSGKTTLLHMLAGLLRPDAGKVSVDGVDLYRMKDKEQSRFRNEHIGLITQKHLSVQSLNVLENILLPCSLYHGGCTDEEKALELLDYFQMADMKEALPGELSGGELRRMNVIRVLAADTEILMADEPTGDMDAENTQRVLKKLREKADAGTAVLLVTHETTAEKYADQIYFMEEGCLKSEG